jgi:DNA-binding beta-propeller fold protein YncE
MSKTYKVLCIILATLFLSGFSFLQAEYQVKKIDFLSRYGLDVNGAGPLVVKTDTTRNRIILVNTNTSSVSIIDGKDDSVVNIPIKSRVPQYLKEELLAMDKKTGNVYVIGNKSLHIVFPDKRSAISIDTGEQYEMAAVDESNGNAFLVGRESKFLAKIDPESKKIKRIPWVDTAEKMRNLNQTPPPPIRKVIYDGVLKQIIAVDGYTATLHLFRAKSGKLIGKRKIAVKGGSRWNLAGYNEKTHHLYMVIETDKRVVQEAVKINIQSKTSDKDTIVDLPGLHESPVALLNIKREEVYIPYDNHPTVHVVDFKPLKESKKDRVSEIKIPNYGNDALALDEENDILYVSSWGYGEIEVIDLKAGVMTKRIREVGIIPHMFNMTYNPHTKKLIIPLGATAVNGSFGASLTVLDPETEKMSKIHTGWAPVDLVELKSKDGFLVFNSEDEAAEVTADGKVTYFPLPCWLVHRALETREGNIYLSYGPHQSYWPVVYIWAAKNGILGINPNTMKFYDRRIPRMVHQMTLDKNGVFYGLQNNWGGEKQFLITLPDEVRSPNLGNMRLELEDKVQRETTQRILTYDPQKHRLYIVRTGETDDERGILQIFDPETKKTLLKYPTGLTPTDLVFDDTTIYIANFDSDTIAAIGKENYSVQMMKTGAKPFKLALLNDTLFCINHNGNSLQAFGANAGTYPLPFKGKPSNLFSTGKKLIITGHTTDAFYVFAFCPTKKVITQVHKEIYPYGETTVDTNNSAFYVRAQFADGIFEVNQIKQDKKGRVWITDYLSGKLFVF